MRKLLLLSLLATAAATPAFAQDVGEHQGNDADSTSVSSPSNDRGSRRWERATSSRSEDSSSRSDQPSRRERPVMRERPAEIGQQPSDVTPRQFGNDNADVPTRPTLPAAGDTVRNWRRGVGGTTDQQSDSVRNWRGRGIGGTTEQQGDSVRNWRGRDRRPDSPSEIQDRNLGDAPAVDNRSIEERNQRRVGDGAFDRNVRTTPGFGGRRVGRIGNNVPVEGSAPPPVTTEQARRGSDNHRRWTGDWRRDNRYDWRRHRDRNRSRFHFGFYYDPFGWSYRRYNIGWRLWPSYYGQDYWLNDPWQYRLPPAYGPYRWVRYYDDALLVNIYTGTVVDVIHNFFW